MSNLIQIKRSATSGQPSSLNPGELAYSNTSQVIYVGSTDGASVVPIGGARNPGILTANQALVANSTSGLNSIQIANAVFVGATQTLNANGGVGTAGQFLISGGTSSNLYWYTPPPSVTGTNTYIQFNDSGTLNAVAGFTFNKTTNTVTVGNTIVVGTFTANSTLANAAAINVVGAASIGGNTTISGTLVVTGNVYAAGNTFLVNATAITTNDFAMYLANNQGTSALANGAGIYVGNSAAPIASFLYNNATTSFQSNVGLTPSTNNLLLGTSTNLWDVNANTINAVTISIDGVSVNTMISGNAATAYSNATTFSSNATNITSGVLSYQFGGTSQTTYSLGDLLVGNSSSGISRLSVGTNGYILQSNGTTVVYATLDGGSF